MLVADQACTAVKEWCYENRLCLNMNKTECVVFYTDRPDKTAPPSIQVQDSNISISESTKFLGLQLDANMKWRTHVEYLDGRLNTVIYSLNVLKHHVNANALRIVYFSNFESLVNYGVAFWAGGSFSDRIFVKQKQALRTIFHMSYLESCRGVFRRNGILTLRGLYIFHRLMFVREHGYLFEQFRNSNNTRRCHHYFYPLHSLTLTENSMQYCCLKIFNVLPRLYQEVTRPELFGK
ncbi:hypothetical protein HHI36_003280 [Cryptolaemus montrouzieri]|uniref:Reverse transcriptase n=1 Tax=Cryptolaemus montrouzieri TaxID=559131 RepID=A0ABD2PDH8_9CUCU